MQIADESTAYGAAGPDVRTFTAGGAQVLMGSESMVIIAEIGDDLTASSVRNHRQLTLTGPVVPAEFNAILNETLHGPRHRLFVRMPEGLLDLGVGRCFRSHWSGIDSVLHSADIRLDQPLSWETLDLVHPLHRSNSRALPGWTI